MKHDELSDLLQSLPMTPASRGFTARTLARATTPRRSRRREVRAVFAFVLSAILLLSGAIGIRHHHETVRLQQMRAEQKQIRKELDNLKAISNESDPRLFVGGSGPYDFVIDLQHVRSSSAPPASVHIADDGVF